MGPEQRREAGGGNTQRERGGGRVKVEVVVVVGVGRRILQANTHAAVWAG